MSSQEVCAWMDGCREINQLSSAQGGPRTGLHLPATTGHPGICRGSALEANVPELAANQRQDFLPAPGR